MSTPRTRRWRPARQVDIPAALAPLRRGRGDPTCQFDGAGVPWLALGTAAGPATLAVRWAADEVVATAWGEGAEAALAGLPGLLGDGDDDTGFTAHHPIVARVRRRLPGLRLGATGRVWPVLVPAILEQKVTGIEARRSWRELCRRFGEPAPGPAPARMHLPPTPEALLAITDWQWHAVGVDGARRRTLRAAATVAHRLERAVTLRGEAGRALLRRVPGIGPWTAAEVAQRAWGDPDAVSVGDFHIPAVVGLALIGRPCDDEGMLRALAPYAPQRQRAVRYLEAAGVHRPRFGPRYPVRDYRTL